jgi:hypothetical protein
MDRATSRKLLVVIPGRAEGANPEGGAVALVALDSGSGAARRPGMTAESPRPYHPMFLMLAPLSQFAPSA